MGTSTNARLADILVVDSDFHLTEGLDDFIEYARGPFGKQLRETPEHHTHGLYPSPGLYNNINRGYNETRSVNTRGGVEDAMERFYLDQVILSPTRNLYLSCVQHDDIAAVLASAYNEWLLDEFVDPDAGIYSTILLPTQKPNRAAEIVDEFGPEDGMVSAFMPSGGMDPLAGNRVYHPIYEACQDHDIPLAMHAASGNMQWTFPHTAKKFNRLLPVHLVSHPMIHMTNLADMVTRGIFVRYPDLRLIVQEAGLGWVPYFLRRFDLEYRNNREDAPMLEGNPSEYILDRCHFTSQPIEGSRDIDYITAVLELMDGRNTLMFSSDYPHFDFDNADELLKALSRFDDEAVENIYGRTAQTVYDIG